MRMITFTVDIIKGYWRKALRRGVLFTALDKLDREYLYLTMKVLDELRSGVVKNVISGILVKLDEAFKSPFFRKVETFGVEKARSISEKAVEWGYEEAVKWARDDGFMTYLTINTIPT